MESYLTKDDFEILPIKKEDRHNGICWLYIHNAKCGFSEKYYEKLIEQILKNQDDAKKLRQIREKVEKIGNVPFIWSQIQKILGEEK